MEKCFLCNDLLEHEYQVRIINTNNGTIEFVKCCSLKCAEILKENNAEIHKSRYEDVQYQCIQKLK